jgi:hypothetical protein
MRFLGLILLYSNFVLSAPLTSSEILKIKGSMKGEMDLSGLTCLTKTCYFISDDVALIQTAQLNLEKKEFTKGQDIVIKDKTIDLDLEAITQLHNKLFIIGSHGIDRKGDKKESRFSVIAYDLKKNEYTETTLTPVIKNHPVLKNYFKVKLDKNGLNIEGLASFGQHLFVGLRAPYLDGVYILEVEESMKLVKEHFIKTPKAMGIRAMTNTKDGLLMILGDSNPNSSDVFQGSDKNSLYYYDFKNVVHVQDFQTKNKLEAIEVIEEDDKKIKFITLSDSIKEGEPTLYTIERSLLKVKK